MKTKISPSKQRSFRRSAEQRSYTNDRQQVERRKLKKQRKREARRIQRRMNDND